MNLFNLINKASVDQYKSKAYSNLRHNLKVMGSTLATSNSNEVITKSMLDVIKSLNSILRNNIKEVNYSFMILDQRSVNDICTSITKTPLNFLQFENNSNEDIKKFINLISSLADKFMPGYFDIIKNTLIQSVDLQGFWL